MSFIASSILFKENVFHVFKGFEMKILELFDFKVNDVHEDSDLIHTKTKGHSNVRQMRSYCLNQSKE